MKNTRPDNVMTSPNVYSQIKKLILSGDMSAGEKLASQQLADRLRKPQSFVAKYEGGERRLDVVEFVAVAQAIGADPLRILRALLKDQA